MSVVLPNIHVILTNYVNAMGKLIAFLNKKIPGDVHITKAKNLFAIAKNNEPVLFEDTHGIILEYHKQIASGDRKSLLDIDFNSKLDGLDKGNVEEKSETLEKVKKLESDDVIILKTVISQIQNLIQGLNDSEWDYTSRLLKDLLVSTSQHKIVTKANGDKK